MRLRHITTLTAILVGIVIAGPVRAETTPQQPTSSLATDSRMDWWREAKFGMFIHWGLYAIPAGEWDGKPVKGIGEWIMNNGHIPLHDYEKLAGQFNPEKFDARVWVKTAKNAGQKYIVITSKHHDGFCLWDSKVSDYTVMHSPFHRDILKELADAVKEEGGIRLCFYHSIMDWHHPDAQSVNEPNYNPGKNGSKNPNFPRYVETYLKPQLKELLTNYGPIGVVWFDGEWVPEYTDEMGWDIYKYCRSLQPEVIVNNRVGKSRKGMMGFSTDQKSPGDFGTPEQQIPPTGLPGVDWESCMTMNDTWGYKKDDNHWKSNETLIRNLVDTASKGGNFLLNVGPTAEGVFPDAINERLGAIGTWMAANHESIYGTSPSPLGKQAWGCSTAKGSTCYLHVFTWPAEGRLVASGLANKPLRAYMLRDPATALEVTAGNEGPSIKLPPEAPDKIDSVVVLEVEGQPATRPAN